MGQVLIFSVSMGAQYGSMKYSCVCWVALTTDAPPALAPALAFYTLTKKMVGPPGVEPGSTASEAVMLSITPWTHRIKPSSLKLRFEGKAPHEVWRA